MPIRSRLPFAAFALILAACGGSETTTPGTGGGGGTGGEGGSGTGGEGTTSSSQASTSSSASTTSSSASTGGGGTGGTGGGTGGTGPTSTSSTATGTGGTGGTGGATTSTTATASTTTAATTSSTGTGTGGGPTTGGFGDPCTEDTDCNGFFCLTEEISGYPKGYCSDLCYGSGEACPPNGTCFAASGAYGACLETCSTAADCQPNYDCVDGGASTGNQKVCTPKCTDNAQCANGTCGGDGYCATPEVCDGLADEDADGDFDCADADCSGKAECTPGMGDVGTACTKNADCKSAAGNDPACFQQNGGEWKDGYCTEFCSLTADNCATGSTCLSVGLPDLGLCFDLCVAGGDCRSGYSCTTINGTTDKYCLPSCAADADCAPGEKCDVGSKTCIECTSDAECGNGLLCDTDGTCY